MTDHDASNAEQVKYWSQDAGPRWVALQDRSDAQLRAFGLRAMDAAGDLAGAHVLDVGAGCGDSTLELARRVSSLGHVHAVDVSSVMLSRARERAAEAGASNVTFQLGDAQSDPIEGAPHDIVFSRFGVMFFADPPLAFRKLREASRPGGRLAFACWRSPAENAWLAGGIKIAKGFVEMPPPPEPHAPGPFGLFDRDLTLERLGAAGWKDVAIEPFDHDMLLGGGGSLEETLDFLVRLGPIATAMAPAPADVQQRLLDALREFLAPCLRPEGIVMTGAAWIVTGRS